MPLPMVTIMATGKSVGGKLRCVKEFLIVPAPGMPVLEVRSSFMLSASVLTNYIALTMQHYVTITLCNDNENHSLSILTAILPGGFVLAGTRMSLFLNLSELRMMEMVVTSGGNENHWSAINAKCLPIL